MRDERTLGRAGLLAALAPLVVPTLLEIAELSAREAGHDPLPGLLPIAVLVAATLVDAALLLARNPSRGRSLLTIGGVAFAILATIGLRQHPAQALALLLATMMFGSWIYSAPEAAEPGHTLRNSKVARARMAAVGSIAAPFFLVGFRMSDSPHAVPVQIVSVLIALVLALRAVRRIRLRSRDLGILIATVVSCALVIPLRDHPDLAIFAMTPLSISLLVSLRTRMIRDPLQDVGWIDLLLDQPARVMVGTFLVTGLAGGVALSLPICSTHERVLLLDATFTAFSAVCVTGLTVIDTATAYSQFGQGVVMTLIQIGGLGIMAFSTAAMVLLGQRMTLKHEGAAIELLGGDRQTGVRTALRRVLVVTGVSELIGAIALTLLFWGHGEPWADAVWQGVFTSISAYCNAGFALQSNSLVNYQDNPLILHVIALLIIVGGLGPAVVIATPSSLLRWRRAPLHTRIVVLTTAILLIIPAFLIAALEWNHSLAGLSTGARLHNAWFQSVTTRTAGFNSVDFAAMTPATLTLVEGLMFVGGSPGSTAGGLKTTTLFVLVMAVVAVTSNKTMVVWGNWTIPHATVYRAAAVVTLGAASVVFGVFAILLTQALDTQTALFEVVSALATVGLSTGGTGMLDSVGKQIIITCMFMGRVGPLTLFLMFNRPARHPGGWTFPEQDVSVG